MARIIVPPDPEASEVKIQQDVFVDTPHGLAWDIFGNELKELVILYPNDPEGPKPHPPPVNLKIITQYFWLRQFEFRGVSVYNETLGYSNLIIYTYDLTVEAGLNGLLQEDFTNLLLEDDSLILLEE